MDLLRAEAEATDLLPFAKRVLQRYPLEVKEIRHLASHSNVMFALVTASGHQRVLRVGTPHANSRSNLEIEVAWLDAIRADTDLDVVAPIAASDGSLIVDSYDDELGKERSCVLFSWVPGQPLAMGSGTFAYRQLGEMCASLQLHGRTWTPPNGSAMRIWNEVFYYRNELDPVVMHTPEYSHLFEVPVLKVIAKAIRLAQDVIVDSYAGAQPQVVHGDLHEWNVHLAGSRLYAFDFEDTMLALPAQDAAICLYSSRTSELRSDIRSAFRRGYEAVLPWPIVDERQLDGFHAARQIMLMNYAGRTLPTPEAADFINRVMPWLERYVDRYE